MVDAPENKPTESDDLLGAYNARQAEKAIRGQSASTPASNFGFATLKWAGIVVGGFFGVTLLAGGLTSLAQALKLGPFAPDRADFQSTKIIQACKATFTGYAFYGDTGDTSALVAGDQHVSECEKQLSASSNIAMAASATECNAVILSTRKIIGEERNSDLLRLVYNNANQRYAAGEIGEKSTREFGEWLVALQSNCDPL